MIITYPNPILEKKSEKIIDPQSSEVRKLILEMIEEMDKDPNAVGLAAPQVGQSVRLCIIKSDNNTWIFINPKIRVRSWKKVVAEEGCLSFPGQFFPVKRSQKVTVEAIDRHGKKFTVKADGLFSRTLQHEIDHLEGILFITRIIKTKQNEREKN